MNTFFWILFGILILAMLAIDLFFFNRKNEKVSVKKALYWSAGWIALSLLFNLCIYFWQGEQPAIEFLTGYLIEKSLSVDNLFVFLMVFNYFHIKPEYQHKVLLWGILGALVMRAGFIFAGIALIEKFDFMIYLLGIILIYGGIKMLRKRADELDPAENTIIRTVSRILPVAKNHKKGEFFTRKNGRLFVTRLFLALVVIEITDILFALDSIPAILAITREPFLVYSSNIFAILGLRALYFALAGIMDSFYYLKYGLAAILIFVGIKIMLSEVIEINTIISLGVIVTILGISVFASLKSRKNIKKEAPGEKAEI